MLRRLFALAVLAGPLLLLACPPSGRPEAGGAGDPVRGRQVYMANCIACHSPDPSRDGPLGPALKGSPRELVEARVLRVEYPKGYTPKRPTKLMTPLPHLAPSIPDLAAFLNSP